MKKRSKTVNFSQHVSLKMVKDESIPADQEEISHLPKQIKAVLALYKTLLQCLYRLSACILDNRVDDADVFRRKCLSVLHMLDSGLNLNSNLAANLHTLYGHC